MALYRRLLIKFRDGNADFGRQFRAKLKEADHETSTRLAHTLKGVAGNIGARELQAAAKRLEAACAEHRSSDDINRLLDNVTEVLQTVLEGLKGLDKVDNTEATANTNSPVNTAQVATQVKELASLIADDDTAANDLLDQLDAQLQSPETKKALRQLQKLIGEYDFESAQDVVSELADKLDIELN